MKAGIFTVLLMAGLGAIYSLAAPMPMPPVQDHMHRVMERVFAGFKVEETGVQDINGIKVHMLKVTGGGGNTAGGAITEHGDLLLAGVPHDPRRLPGPVEDIVKRLFPNLPANVDLYTVTNYIVHIDTNGEQDDLVLDAVGRFKDIHPAAQIERNVELLGKEDFMGKDAEITRRMESMAERFFGKGSKVQHIYADPVLEHWFHVELTDAEGVLHRAVTNSNDLESRSMPLQINEVPKPVLNMVTELFKNAKIVSVERKEWTYYQFNEPLGADNIVMRIKTNGEIIAVKSALSQQDTAQIEQMNKQP